MTARVCVGSAGGKREKLSANDEVRVEHDLVAASRSGVQPSDRQQLGKSFSNLPFFSSFNDVTQCMQMNRNDA